jgi:hypothetical protein
MPKGEELAKFQTAGTLPSPLPPYRLGIFDYVRRLLAVVGPCPGGAVLGHRGLAQAQGSRVGTAAAPQA